MGKFPKKYPIILGQVQETTSDWGARKVTFENARIKRERTGISRMTVGISRMTVNTRVRQLVHSVKRLWCACYTVCRPYGCTDPRYQARWLTELRTPAPTERPAMLNAPPFQHTCLCEVTDPLVLVPAMTSGPFAPPFHPHRGLLPGFYTSF